MKLLQSNHVQYRSQLIALYINAFSIGVSKQNIDKAELARYIDRILTDGIVYMVKEGEDVIGALLCCPLESDQYLPDEIRRNFRMDTSVYISELMIAEHFQRKGLGLKLLNFFFENIDNKQYTDVFIRVWDKNIPALRLYQKVGFKELMIIQQTKLMPDGEGAFVMNKIYLHKNS